MKGRNRDGVTRVTPERRRPWNVTFAAEPFSSRERAAVLSTPAIHQYVVLILALTLGITLLVLFGRAPIGELICAVCFGWALGQVFRWESPR